MRSWRVNPFWNADERRLRAGWRILAPLLLLFAIALGAAAIGAPVRRALADALDPFGRSVGAAILSVALYTAWSVAVVSAVWLVSRFVDRRSLRDLGLRLDARWWEDAAFGVALGGVLMSGILGAEVAFDWGHYSAEGPPRAAYVSMVAIAFVGVAINEELLFRGNQLKNLAEGLASRRIPPRSAAAGAVLLSSVVFGLFHVRNPSASLVSTGNIVLAGLMLASGYLVTGRLGIAIGLHFSWNFFQNLYGMPVSGQTHFFSGALLSRREAGPDWITGGPFGPEAGLTGLCAMFAGTLATLAWARLRYGPLRIDPTIAALPPRVAARLPERSVGAEP